MAKIYERVRGDNGVYGWEDFPSNNTSVNAQRLNHMDVGIDENDTRISKLETIKATKTEVAPLIKEISFNESNGVFTITRKNGEKFSFDTKMEKIAINFDYDPIEQEIILTLIDGTKQYIDLSKLLTQYEFLNTDTVAFFIDDFGSVYAYVKDGSIEERHLRPDYLAEIKVEVSKSEAGARNSDIYAKLSQSYAVGGTNSRDGEDTDNSKYYYQQSKTIYDNFSQAGAVTGVKGDAEDDYQTGNVNLTAENIGAYGKLNIGTSGYNYRSNCIMISGVSLNEIDESGLYFCDAPLDAPITTNGFMIAITYAGKIRGMQLFMPLGENQIYKRQNTNGTWGSWEKIKAGSAETAINKNGDNVPGIINFVNNARIRFIAPDVTSLHAKGIDFMNKAGTGIWGGIGAYGQGGQNTAIYLAADTPAPWEPANGLFITGSSIKWKNYNLVTENSGVATAAKKATQDGNGNVIADTYTRKEWIYIGRATDKGGKVIIGIEYPSDIFIAISEYSYSSSGASVEFSKTYMIPAQSIGIEGTSEINLPIDDFGKIIVKKDVHPTVINSTYGKIAEVYAR